VVSYVAVGECILLYINDSIEDTAKFVFLLGLAAMEREAVGGAAPEQTLDLLELP
jgi:hypothetical protein